MGTLNFAIGIRFALSDKWNVFVLELFGFDNLQSNDTVRLGKEQFCDIYIWGEGNDYLIRQYGDSSHLESLNDEWNYYLAVDDTPNGVHKPWELDKLSHSGKIEVDLLQITFTLLNIPLRLTGISKKEALIPPTMGG